jgi:hypothetical protein
MDSVAATVQAAGEFGLTSHELWEVVMATPDRLPTDLKARYIDELSAEFASRLLEKQRSSQDALPPRTPLLDSDVPGLARRCLRWAGLI